MLLIIPCLIALGILLGLYSKPDFANYRNSRIKKILIENLIGGTNQVYWWLLSDHWISLLTLSLGLAINFMLPRFITEILFVYTASFLSLRILLFMHFNERPFAPAWNDDSRSALRKLLTRFDAVCQENTLDYVTADGAVLGYERSGQMIPWDGDVDVVMGVNGWKKLRELEPEFRDHGIGLDFDHSPHMVIASLTERPDIYSPVEMKGYQHSWPHIEISELFEIGSGNLSIGGKILPRRIVLPPRRVAFENLSFMMPRDSRSYTIEMFGPTWATLFIPEAYCNRYRFGYSWPKIRVKNPRISAPLYLLLVVTGLVADFFTPHKRFYLAKLLVLCICLAPLPARI